MTSNAELLRKAATVLKERGHAKGVLVDAVTDGVCLLGAINVAVSGSPRWPDKAAHHKKSDRLLSLVGAYLSRKFRKQITASGAVAWNNKRETKAAEVIAALRSTARSVARKAA